MTITTSLATASTGSTSTSGTGPLSVWFDATGTTSTNTSRPFGQLIYIWDFGDPGGTWTNGALGTADKNTDYGPVACHTFDPTEGGGNKTYTVSLIVYDPNNGDVANTSVSITANDPAIVYSGTNTVCISTSGNFTGAPAGSTHTTSGSIQSVSANKRYLYCGGESWAVTAEINPSTTSWCVGNYGTGKPTFTSTSGLSCFNLTSGNARYVIRDLILKGNNGSGFGVQTNNQQAAQGVLLRLDNSNNRGGYVLDGPQISHVDCTSLSVAASAVAVYINPNHVIASYRSVMGCNIDISGSSAAFETLRAPYLRLGVISHNTITGAGVSYAAVKIHNQSAGGTSEFNVLRDNNIGSSSDTSPNMVELATQNNVANEFLQFFLFEGNNVTTNLNTTRPLWLSGENYWIRNNLFIDFNSSSGTIQVERRGIEPVPNLIDIYNNTFYNSHSVSGYVCIRITSGSTNTTVINNLPYAPSASSPVFLSNSGTGTTQSNNGTISSNPSFVGTTNFADFKIQTGSYAKNAGIAVRNAIDAFEVYRPQGSNLDLGFAEFDQGTPAPWDGPAPDPMFDEDTWHIMEPQLNPLRISKW